MYWPVVGPIRMCTSCSFVMCLFLTVKITLHRGTSLFKTPSQTSLTKPSLFRILFLSQVLLVSAWVYVTLTGISGSFCLPCCNIDIILTFSKSPGASPLLWNELIININHLDMSLVGSFETLTSKLPRPGNLILFEMSSSCFNILLSYCNGKYFNIIIVWSQYSVWLFPKERTEIFFSTSAFSTRLLTVLSLPFLVMAILTGFSESLINLALKDEQKSSSDDFHLL